jgi:hypothetical protein
VTPRISAATADGGETASTIAHAAMPATARIVPSPIHFLKLDDAVAASPLSLSSKHAILAAGRPSKIACPVTFHRAWQRGENA